ncbi:conjugative transposon protein TraN [Sphingobacterium detergens]|uniref:Conjugative transposon TraN protein n=1 Tax=Sphingobacterium detergens TaxID=1145106 RepID=A0A420AS21_SPHD1|nr:conjugative transposon protein TraN [Sphingobacterium detergens]RKE47183.1 conjugative transposon TraN protein [Sphingobacterium detergens]
MEKICAVLILVVCQLIAGKSFGQQSADNMQRSSIQPGALLIGFDKTTNIIYPYAIKSVDKGSKEVLVQLAKGVENILQVKAAKQGFSETNLTVVTADGKLYSHLLNYTDNPKVLNIKLGNSINFPNADALFSYKADNEAKVYDLTEQIASRKPVLKGIKDSKYNISLNLAGIYIKGDKLYFQFALENDSEVDYPVEAFRFYIKDSKSAKRTAKQEVEQLPVQQAGNAELIRGKSQQMVVVALPRFTIPDKKVLMIELMEANGGRHLNLRVKNKTIIAAQSIH